MSCSETPRLARSRRMIAPRRACASCQITLPAHCGPAASAYSNFFERPLLRKPRCCFSPVLGRLLPLLERTVPRETWVTPPWNVDGAMRRRAPMWARAWFSAESDVFHFHRLPIQKRPPLLFTSLISNGPVLECAGHRIARPRYHYFRLDPSATRFLRMSRIRQRRWLPHGPYRFAL